MNGILKDKLELEQYDVDTGTMKKLVKDSVTIYNTKCSLLLVLYSYA